MTSLDPNTALAQVRAALARATPTGFREPLEITSMPGGASTRKFFRVRAAGGASLVAMFVPAPSQEINKAQQARTTGPFVEVHALLAAADVRVPALIRHDHDLQVLLVEDLGDDTLAEFLRRSPEQRQELYTSAVVSLARAQTRLCSLPADCIVRTRAFDRELLAWEIEHFRDYALSGRGISLTPLDEEIFSRAQTWLASEIASWPKVFVHRDYQSRNLMVRGGAFEAQDELVWIDFQDAMLGPRVYDLVALLTDSYQTFSREFVLERLQEYTVAAGIRDELSRVVFEFDVVTVQRKLKDAGRFVFLDKNNGVSSFLQYVEPTIDKVFAALARLRDKTPLVELERSLARVLGRA